MRIEEIIAQIKGNHVGINGQDLMLLYECLPIIEKQIPKPVEMSHCHCGMIVGDDMQYCPSCGQRLGERFGLEGVQ